MFGDWMVKYKGYRAYALRVARFVKAVEELEEHAMKLPDARVGTVELLESYSRRPKVPYRVLKNAADEISAIGMLEILHE